MRKLLFSLITFASFAFLLFVTSPVQVLPSHPFVDDNNNGIDDFDEDAGRYENPEEKAKVYGIDFPVAELENCTDFYSCRTYCEDPVNQSTCVSFAQSKGFYKDEPLQTKVEVILSAAKSSLGCDSVGACQQYCEIPANYDACHRFATGQGLGGGYVEDPAKPQFIEKAKQVLGCDSESSCRSFCDDPANAAQCTNFAREAGLRGGEKPVGPGGCTSESTCRAFCSDPNNYQVCSGFHQASGATFAGPGGCNSEESCRSYCSQNERACRSFGGPGPGGAAGGYNPQEMCNRTPNCAWQGNTCQCGFYGETRESSQKAGEYASFCSANPDKCKPGATGGFESSEQRAEFEKFCRENPEKCRPPAGATYTGPSPYPGGYYGGTDPAAECSKYGCTWTGSACNCSGTGYTPSYTTSCEPPASGCGSGTWDRGTCTCKPATGCPAGTSWTGTYCMQDTGPSGSGTSGSGTYTPLPTYSQPSGSYTPAPYSEPSSGTYTPPSGESYTPPSDSGSYTQPSGESSGSYTPPSSGESGGSYTPPSGESGGVYGTSAQGSWLRNLILRLFGK